MFYLIILIIIIQRLVELRIAKKNEQWLRSQGAIEFGADHYKYIVLLHCLFFISMIVEYNFRGTDVEFNIINYLFLVFLFLLQVIRLWILKTLGKYWNTKILRIPNAKLVTSGPYKYLKHPNYVVVVCEIFTLPMIFDLYYTAIIFSVLNAIILFERIRVENKALQ